MNEELTEFLRRNRACADGIARLEASGAETLADAWDNASPADLVWAVTRHGVMSPEQRRLFLVMVLSSIEDKLTDRRSKNILDKLRAKSPITKADKDAAWVAARAAAYAAAYAAQAAEASSWAADAAEAAWADEAAWTAAAEAASAAADVSAVREQQARWIRTNFRLAELHTN